MQVMVASTGIALGGGGGTRRDPWVVAMFLIWVLVTWCVQAVKVH